jgi:dienelactone hydrolase
MRALGLLLLLLAGCSTTPSFSSLTGLPSPSTMLSMGDSDLERTWSNATIVLPPLRGEASPVLNPASRRIDRHLAAFQATRGFPTVIYMHGCTGLSVIGFLEQIASAGFVVVAPDSMARRYRPLQCNPWNHGPTGNLFVFDFRLAELSYALQQLRGLDWVDRDNLYLVGVSEGGVAAAIYRGDDVRARVILQWDCQGPAVMRGIAAPPQTPVLTMLRTGDPWYSRGVATAAPRHCGEFLGFRPESRSVVLPAGGADGHDLLGDSAVVREIVAFLSSQVRRGAAAAR